LAKSERELITGRSSIFVAGPSDVKDSISDSSGEIDPKYLSTKTSGEHEQWQLDLGNFELYAFQSRSWIV
jgi:hypothetical protein